MLPSRLISVRRLHLPALAWIITIMGGFLQWFQSNDSFVELCEAAS